MESKYEYIGEIDMSNWFIVNDKNDFHVLHKSEFVNNSAAISLFDFLKNNLDSADASFYHYLEGLPMREEVEISDIDVYPSLEKAVNLLEEMSRDEIYNELSVYNSLDTLFKSEAKRILSEALERKAAVILEVANNLKQ
ncbi:hypothetical protein D3C78_1503360 [compost metagenome]